MGRRHFVAGAAAALTAATTRVAVAADHLPALGRVAERSRALRPGLTTIEASFAQVAVVWHTGEPSCQVRAHGAAGWSRWHHLHRFTEGVGRVQGSDLVWFGDSDRVQVRRADSAATGVRLVLLDPAGRPGDAVRRTPNKAAATRSKKPKPPTSAPKPALFSRKRWGANEKWRNGGPRYNKTIKQVHVHHTATGNDYSRRDVPRLLRGIYRYHTKTLGWSDIGYNFLIDRFGRIWVGRAGGPGRPVRGAHTLGFNNTSVGIALIGTFTDEVPTDAAVGRLVRLAAWKLDKYDRDPRRKIRVRSQGSDLYREGKVVRLPVIDGHRDTNQTECPGEELYDLLPRIRKRVGKRMDRFHD